MKSVWQSFRRMFQEVLHSSTGSHQIPPFPNAFALHSPALAKRQEYDALTGLPQAELFIQQVRAVIETAERKGQLTGIIEIGLNDIKRVNQTFGPRFGDVLIRQAAFRLYSAVKQTDALGRVGAVNFAVALEPFSEVEDALRTAQRLLNILGETFDMIELVEHHVQLSANAGISIYPIHATSAEDLLYQSSIALSQAGISGTNRIELFSLERREESKLRLELEWRMRQALDERQFGLNYQPEIDLRSEQVIRREALLRWESRKTGSISPASFIPIAEQTGLIIPLGRWVLQEACQTAQAWQKTGDAGIGVAVNVSAVQLNETDFATTVEHCLEQTGLPGELLELEITESALITDFKRSSDKILRLRQLGATVVIDDFGVGYSSLAWLKELPVTGVKLDRSFLCDFQNNPNTLPILRSIVALAHGLNMQVTVEGVETTEALEELKKLGVDTVQGYLLGRPESSGSRTAGTGA